MPLEALVHDRNKLGDDIAKVNISLFG